MRAFTAAVVVRQTGRMEDVERGFLTRLVRNADAGVATTPRLIAFAGRVGAIGDRAYARWEVAEWGSLERRRLHRLLTRAYAAAAHALRRLGQRPRRPIKGLTHRPFAKLCGMGLPARSTPCPEVQDALELVEAQIPLGNQHKNTEGTTSLLPTTKETIMSKTTETTTAVAETTTAVAETTVAVEAAAAKPAKAKEAVVLAGLEGSLTRAVDQITEVGEALLAATGEAEKSAASAAAAASSAAQAATSAASIATGLDAYAIRAVAVSTDATAQAAERAAATLFDVSEKATKSNELLEELASRTRPAPAPVGWKARGKQIAKFVAVEGLRPMAKGALAFIGVVAVKAAMDALSGAPEAPATVVAGEAGAAVV